MSLFQYSKVDFGIFLSQVNGIDTVRVPISLEPYQDLAAKYQKQLKRQPHAGTDASKADNVQTVSEDSASQSGGVSGSAAMSQEITAPSNEGSKKD